MTQTASKVPDDAACERAHGCAHEDLRCSCGSLLARVVTGGVELKCRRCKRTLVIPVQSGGLQP